MKCFICSCGKNFNGKWWNFVFKLDYPDYYHGLQKISPVQQKPELDKVENKNVTLKLFNSSLSNTHSLCELTSKFFQPRLFCKGHVIQLQAHVNKLPVLKLKDVSKFGTWVNNQKVEGERILSDGDSVYFGSQKSSFR